MPRNPFRVKMMRDAYDGSIKAYDVKHKDLFLSNGERRKTGSFGSSFAASFWHGYDGTTSGLYNFSRDGRDTLRYAVWCAGRDVRARESQGSENDKGAA